MVGSKHYDISLTLLKILIHKIPALCLQQQSLHSHQVVDGDLGEKAVSVTHPSISDPASGTFTDKFTTYLQSSVWHIKGLCVTHWIHVNSIGGRLEMREDSDSETNRLLEQSLSTKLRISPGGQFEK